MSTIPCRSLQYIEVGAYCKEEEDVALIMQRINAARLGWPSAAIVGTLTFGLLHAVEDNSMLNSNNYHRPSHDRAVLAITVENRSCQTWRAVISMLHQRHSRDWSLLRILTRSQYWYLTDFTVFSCPECASFAIGMHDISWCLLTFTPFLRATAML